MASNLKFAVLLKNAQQDAITSQVGASGAIDIYDSTGTGQPASPDVAVTTQLLLATLPCSATLAVAAATGILTLSAITSGTGTAAASVGKTATWFRLRTSGGTGKVDGTVGISGADLNLNNTSIATGQTVSSTGGTITSGQ